MSVVSIVELTALEDRMFTILADTKAAKDRNAEVEAELNRRDDSILAIGKRVNALKVELRDSKQPLSGLRVEKANLRTSSSDVTMGLRQIETQVVDALNVVTESVKDVQKSAFWKMRGEFEETCRTMVIHVILEFCVGVAKVRVAFKRGSEKFPGNFDGWCRKMVENTEKGAAQQKVS